MGIERQNIQLRLAFPEGDWGEAPGTYREGTEMSVAVCAPESPAEDGSLMEEVCERENLTEALKRVRANRGSPGVDGMRVEELAGYLREHWPAIREQLLEGSYVPGPVKWVEIPKRGGGERRLGIPTVCWIALSSRRCYRSYRSTGTGLSPSAATAFGLDALPIRRWPKRNGTLARAADGSWTSTLRSSSME